MEFKLTDPMMLFAKVKGNNGKVRELSAILDFNWHYSWILVKEAVEIGHPEVLNRPEDYEAIAARRTPHVISQRGLELTIMTTLDEVTVGDLTAFKVDAIATKLDMPLMVPVDLVLGRTFLNNFTMTIDPKAGILSLD
jgi:hypothetical protein